MRSRAAIALLVSLLGLVCFAGGARTAPPSLSNVDVQPRYFSPNADGIRDSVYWRFTLSMDTAELIVLVRADSMGAPGPIVAVLSDATIAPVTDTLAWGGRDDQGDPLADGRYWIVGRAENTQGTSAAPNLDLFLDRTAPADSITLPSRSLSRTLIHRVEGWATDADPLDTVEVSVTSTGGTQTFPICAPCVLDTTFFGVDVPDAIANDDTVTVVTLAVDRAGNRRLRTRVFAVDSLAPPPPVIDPVPATVDRPSVDIAGTASDADSVHVRRDGTVIARLRVISSRFQTTASLPGVGTYVFDAIAIDRAGNVSAPGPAVTVSYLEPIGLDVPERFLAGDRIQVNVAGTSQRVVVRVLTLSGRLVRTFESETADPYHEFVWDLRDEDGRDAGSGPYVVRVQALLTDGTVFEKRVAMVVTR